MKKSDTFYTINKKYKQLRDKLSFEDSNLLVTVVYEALLYGINDLAKLQKKNLTK